MRCFKIITNKHWGLCRHRASSELWHHNPLGGQRLTFQWTSSSTTTITITRHNSWDNNMSSSSRWPWHLLQVSNRQSDRPWTRAIIMMFTAFSLDIPWLQLVVDLIRKPGTAASDKQTSANTDSNPLTKHGSKNPSPIVFVHLARVL